MLNKMETQTIPEAVEVDRLPGGGVWVVLRKNITETERPPEDGDATQIIYTADEAAFLLPGDRDETAESILEGFDDWWIYGECWTGAPSAPTVAEQLASLNEIAAAIIERGLI